jgi:hypothetical protein
VIFFSLENAFIFNRDKKHLLSFIGFVFPFPLRDSKVKLKIKKCVLLSKATMKATKKTIMEREEEA